MKRHLFGVVAVLLVLCLFLLTGSSLAAPKSGGTLRFADAMFFRSNIGWVGDPGWLIAPSASSLFFDTLLTADSSGGVQPNLATNWKMSPDLKSITLTLRKGVKFQDGSDWNAEVAKWNLDLLIANKNGDYVFADSVDILDNYTIRLNLNGYTNCLLSTMGGTNMTSKAAYDSHGGGKEAAEWLRWNPVGTGPFKIVDFKANVFVKGERFDDYWKGKPYLDAVEIYSVRDPMTRTQSFEAGEMDTIAGNLTKVEYELLQKNKGYTVEKFDLAIQVLVPDSNNPASPLSNPTVLKAIDYAIDRNAIVDNLSFGFWTATHQFAIPGTPSYVTDLKPRNYNIEKAKQLLAEAGYPKGFKTQILGSVITTNRDAMVAFQGMLAKAGITADLNMIDHGAYNQAIRKGWDGFAAAGKLIDANMNFAIATSWAHPLMHPSMKKPDEFLALYKAAVASKEFNPALTQKVIRYMHDDPMFLSFWGVQRGNVNQPYVHDTGFYKYSRALMWDPHKCWLDK